MLGVWKFLLVTCAATFVGAVLSAHWNVLAARRTADWRRRAALLEANFRVDLMLGIGSLLAIGVCANLLAGLRVGTPGATWFDWANGLWVAVLLVGLTVDLPAAHRLAIEARAGSEGRDGGFLAALGRWRTANAVLSASFLVFLVGTLVRWRI